MNNFVQPGRGPKGGKRGNDEKEASRLLLAPQRRSLFGPQMQPDASSS